MDRGFVLAGVLADSGYRYDAGAQRNALKLRMFKGRSSLLSQSDTCDWNFEPTDFELGAKKWFDFNQVSHTPEFLYITTNVRDADEADDPADASNDPRVGALIFRIDLDDLDDGDCSILYRYWYEDGHPYISPVQNAGSTMYLATHVPGGLEGDNLRIYSIADGSTSLGKKDKDISNYDDVDGNCPLPDGNDPCEDQHDGRMSGFRSGNTIGWLWMGDEDGKFPYPHVRVAVFETGSLDKVLEHQILESRARVAAAVGGRQPVRQSRRGALCDGRRPLPEGGWLHPRRPAELERHPDALHRRVDERCRRMGPLRQCPSVRQLPQHLPRVDLHE